MAQRRGFCVSICHNLLPQSTISNGVLAKSAEFGLLRSYITPIPSAPLCSAGAHLVVDDHHDAAPRWAPAVGFPVIELRGVVTFVDGVQYGPPK